MVLVMRSSQVCRLASGRYVKKGDSGEDQS